MAEGKAGQIDKIIIVNVLGRLFIVAAIVRFVFMCVMNCNDGIRCWFIAFASGLQLHSAAAMWYNVYVCVCVLKRGSDVSIFMILCDHNIYNLRYIYGC